MIFEAKRAGLPLAMINGRMSERSFSRWRKAPALHRRYARRASISALRAARATASGCCRSARQRVLVAGDIKFDAPALPADRRELAELSGLTSGRQIWIAASTHEGEELIAAEAHKRLAEVFPDALTLIAPRHPERGEAILRELEAEGLACALRSRGDRPAPRRGDLYLRHDRRARALLSAGRRRFRRQVVFGRRRAKPDRARPARVARSCTGRRSQISPTSTRRSTRRAARSKSPTPAQPRRRADRAFRQHGAACARWRAPPADAVERRAGAVDRSMKALAPLAAG